MRVITLIFGVALGAQASAVGGIEYRGAISAEHNAAFFAELGVRRPQVLTITSGGGEVAAAIELGHWVADHALDVEVPEYCLSSCANYVFTAARHKRIHTGAVVAWHGNYHHLDQTGLWRDDVALRMRRDGEDRGTAERYVRAQVERLVGMEREFFRRIGVDQYLCWVGKMPPYNAPNYYYLDKGDMARFGVDNVVTPPDYPHMDVSAFEHDVVYVRLRADELKPPAPAP